MVETLMPRDLHVHSSVKKPNTYLEEYRLEACKQACREEATSSITSYPVLVSAHHHVDELGNQSLL